VGEGKRNDSQEENSNDDEALECERGGWERRRRRRVEGERDRELVVWVARFRFVSADVLAVRFGVSEQQVNARVRRLVAAGWLSRSRERVGVARAISATRMGCRAVGAPVRRAARTDSQREHELELAWLVARLELRSTAGRVLTERESRAREACGDGPRFSVDVIERGGRREKRWPDLVLEQPGRRVAIEFERTAKGRDRLARIVAGYRVATWFDEVHLLAGDAYVARVLARSLAGAPSDRLMLAPWPGLPAAPRAVVAEALERF